ncbi:hypothetical protein FKW77_003138 [Venturia effusa]|uniref:Uncharacterized protein n=1 Tax=Venturia effusa TaxID=50376 RepID=A0A517L6Z9_9PEZI|nr:hypothetical protein FKW77_003138 [Venturia effusa]
MKASTLVFLLPVAAVTAQRIPQHPPDPWVPDHPIMVVGGVAGGEIMGEVMWGRGWVVMNMMDMGEVPVGGEMGGENMAPLGRGNGMFPGIMTRSLVRKNKLRGDKSAIVPGIQRHLNRRRKG